MKIIGLYAGKQRPFGPRGNQSAIFKSAVNDVEVNALGMVDDHQADTRYHGGEEKALHQFALSGYEKMMKRHPLQHKIFVPGSMGENMTATDMDDESVCIGDIYQIGALKVQVGSPRIPCWKIDHKLNLTDLHTFISHCGITGWYYRVLEGGTLSVGDEITLLERPNPDLSVHRFMQITNMMNTTIEDMQNASEAVGLDPEWKEKLLKRIEIQKQSEADYEV